MHHNYPLYQTSKLPRDSFAMFEFLQDPILMLYRRFSIREKLKFDCIRLVSEDIYGSVYICWEVAGTHQ